MKRIAIILVLSIWLLLVYLVQSIAYVLELLSNTEKEEKLDVFSNLGEHIIYCLIHPITTISELIANKSVVFLVLVIIVTIFLLYIVIKQFLSNEDNTSNQNYKIAKHGSHGSAKFATDTELFNKNHYKKVKEKDIKDMVYASLDFDKLKGMNDDDNSFRETK